MLFEPADVVDVVRDNFLDRLSDRLIDILFCSFCALASLMTIVVLSKTMKAAGMKK